MKRSQQFDTFLDWQAMRAKAQRLEDQLWDERTQLMRYQNEEYLKKHFRF